MKQPYLSFPSPLFAKLVLAIGLLCWTLSSHAISLSEHPKLQAVADELIAQELYTQAELDVVFASATIQESVLKAMTSPAEYKFTWGKYRKLFLQEDRIEQGVDFWEIYFEELSRAESQFGVPASVIVAIIGVESKYGKYKGAHRVLDSLVTLVVGFERRSEFFARELKEFLVLAKENKLDSGEIMGSYAGAVGFPQFISSSYRHYAVDFSGDGVVDLIDQPVDAIGSIANYFIENGWLADQPVSSQEHLSVPDDIIALANRRRKIQFAAAELRAKGAQLAQTIDDAEKLNVLMLDASEVVNEPSKSNTYIVRAGDTACEVAEKFNMSCSLLFKLNKLDSRGAIYRGQRLRLGDVSAATAKASKWVVKTETESTVKARYFYTHENFYVITRYNQSVLYAMAVHDLSAAIERSMRNRSAAKASVN